MTEVDLTSRKRKQAPASHTPPLERSRVDDCSLVFSGNLSHFKSRGANFSGLLTREGQAYFDRTRYISVLERFREPILIFRPRRFGKSLTINMLEHFHGLQYRDTHQTLYQGLDVEKDIAERTVTPGQFFVLKFDFSPINCSPNFEQADRALKARITNSLKKFYITYAMYWDVDELSKNIDPENPAESLWACVEAVNDLLRKARERDDKRLAGI